MISIFNSKKGDFLSDMTYFSFGAFWVIAAILMLFLLSGSHEKQNYEEISVIKDGYQTIQLARTFTQTPIEINGQNKNVGEWASIYFKTKDSKLKYSIAYELSSLGLKVLNPYLSDKNEGTKATFSYYENGVFKESLLVSYVRKKEEQDAFVYTGDLESSDVMIQLPILLDDLSLTPQGTFIQFQIKNIDDGSTLAYTNNPANKI